MNKYVTIILIAFSLMILSGLVVAQSIEVSLSSSEKTAISAFVKSKILGSSVSVGKQVDNGAYKVTSVNINGKPYRIFQPKNIEVKQIG